MKQNRAEKVATCFFLFGETEKPVMVLHHTGHPKQDEILRDYVYGGTYKGQKPAVNRK